MLFFADTKLGHRLRKSVVNGISLLATIFSFVLFAACNLHAQQPAMELDSLDLQPLAWLTTEALVPAGQLEQVTMPDTLDLAERGGEAVHGLTAFLDARHHFSSFGHGLFATQPPCFIHDNGAAQNWGKVLEAVALARAMSGSREGLDRQLDSVRGGMSYALLKRHEPYPVPLARLLMSAQSMNSIQPRRQWITLIAQQQQWLLDQARLTSDQQRAVFGPDDRLWLSDDVERATGPTGFGLQVFTSGSVLRALVRTSQTPGIEGDPQRMSAITRQLLDPRYWSPETQPAMVSPAQNAQFSGHHHSYTQALLGLLYHAHATNDPQLLEFVRRGYEYLRTYGLARIGLFGEGCTTGDMTYLAVRLSQWGVGDYWEDVDQYVRNHLTELQIRDPDRIQRVVHQYAKPLEPAGLGSWCQGVDTEDVIHRSIGLFWSDATHPTLIPLREEAPPHATCLQWVVCCSGNCTKALHIVWESIVDDDPSEQLTTVNLLLNRLHAAVDVGSHLPYEGRVDIHLRQARRLAVRIPRWVDRARVRCQVDGQPQPFAWLDRCLLLSEKPAGSTITIRFPMLEQTEQYSLPWPQDGFWFESTCVPASSQASPPTSFTLTMRGNTLVDIAPRDTRPGVALYGDRTPDRFRVPATMREVTRFRKAESTP